MAKDIGNIKGVNKVGKIGDYGDVLLVNRITGDVFVSDIKIDNEGKTIFSLLNDAGKKEWLPFEKNAYVKVDLKEEYNGTSLKNYFSRGNSYEFACGIVEQSYGIKLEEVYNYDYKNDSYKIKESFLQFKKELNEINRNIEQAIKKNPEYLKVHAREIYGILSDSKFIDIAKDIFVYEKVKNEGSSVVEALKEYDAFKKGQDVVEKLINKQSTLEVSKQNFDAVSMNMKTPVARRIYPIDGVVIPVVARIVGTLLGRDSDNLRKRFPMFRSLKEYIELNKKMPEYIKAKDEYLEKLKERNELLEYFKSDYAKEYKNEIAKIANEIKDINNKLDINIEKITKLTNEKAELENNLKKEVDSNKKREIETSIESINKQIDDIKKEKNNLENNLKEKLDNSKKEDSVESTLTKVESEKKEKHYIEIFIDSNKEMLDSKTIDLLNEIKDGLVEIDSKIETLEKIIENKNDVQEKTSETKPEVMSETKPEVMSETKPEVMSEVKEKTNRTEEEKTENIIELSKKIVSISQKLDSVKSVERNGSYANIGDVELLKNYNIDELTVLFNGLKAELETSTIDAGKAKYGDLPINWESVKTLENYKEIGRLANFELNLESQNVNGCLGVSLIEIGKIDLVEQKTNETIIYEITNGEKKYNQVGELGSDVKFEFNKSLIDNRLVIEPYENFGEFISSRDDLDIINVTIDGIEIDVKNISEKDKERVIDALGSLFENKEKAIEMINDSIEGKENVESNTESTGDTVENDYATEEEIESVEAQEERKIDDFIEESIEDF